MARQSKQFGASATASERKVFFWVHLKLTAIYVVILAVIVLGFSVFLYQSVQSNISDTTDGEFVDGPAQATFVQRTLNSVEKDIILVDFVIIIIVAGTSYMLAGYTLKPIQSALEAQKKFSENASHELRTPLAVMKNDIEVLLRNQNPTSEAIRSTLLSSIEEIDRMSKMTNDLLTVARSEKNTTSFTDKLDAAEIVQQIAKKIQPIAVRNGVEIVTNQHKPLVVLGNKAGLEHIVMNIIQNAVQHTPKNGTITIDTDQKGSHVIIKISDTGSGIDEKDLPHIFDRFYKGEQSSGSGLGLAIVKELVTQHGGTIDIVSAKGRGTTVAIKLRSAA